MKIIVVLVAAIMIFSILFSAPTLASPHPLVSRFESFMFFIGRNVYPLSGTFFAPIEFESINNRINEELGGDADDYANGKNDETGEGPRKDDNLKSGLNGNAKTQTECKLILYGRH